MLFTDFVKNTDLNDDEWKKDECLLWTEKVRETGASRDWQFNNEGSCCVWCSAL